MAHLLWEEGDEGDGDLALGQDRSGPCDADAEAELDEHGQEEQGGGEGAQGLPYNHVCARAAERLDQNGVKQIKHVARVVNGCGVTCPIIGSSIPPEISSCTNKVYPLVRDDNARTRRKKTDSTGACCEPLWVDILGCKIHGSEFQMQVRKGPRRKPPIESVG
jgi:hypothetical protein